MSKNHGGMIVSTVLTFVVDVSGYLAIWSEVLSANVSNLLILHYTTVLVISTGKCHTNFVSFCRWSISISHDH